MKVSLSPETIAQIDGSVMHMIGVANELIAVTSEESRRLNHKHPLPIEDLLIRKQELVVEYERWMKQFSTQQHLLLQGNRDLFEELLDCNEVLSVALAENSAALKKAMKISKRRVETIMRAIREERQVPAGYGDGGQYNAQGSHPVSIRPPFEA